jgi:hypothetical protein
MSEQDLSRVCWITVEGRHGKDFEPLSTQLVQANSTIRLKILALVWGIPGYIGQLSRLPTRFSRCVTPRFAIVDLFSKP